MLMQGHERLQITGTNDILQQKGRHTSNELKIEVRPPL